MSLLPASISSLFGSDPSLLATAYGLNGNAGSGQSPIIALATAERDQARDIKRTAAEPEVARAIKTFTAAVKGATDVRQLLANPGAMRVLLIANGLGDQANFTALARKALMSNPADPKSVVNQLTDLRWKPVVKTYQFATKGLSVIKDPKVIDTVAGAFAEFSWRQSLEKSTPGLSKALTFRAQAAKFTSADQILGDAVMRDVVTTALGIPKQIAFQPLEAQEKAITTRLDIKKLQDPKFVENFTKRYLMNVTADAATTPDLTTLATRLRGLVV